MTIAAPVRVALLGYGYAGRTFHAPLIGAEPALALAAVMSRDPARVRADLPGMAVHGDADAAIAAAELVVIATPNHSHAPLARAAIAAGRHVVVDKPFTLDLAEARDLAARAEHAGTLLSVFHNRRWDSDFLTVRDAIAAGAIGRPAGIDLHFDRFRPQVRDRWRERDGAGGGLWCDLGPHLVDQALLLLGLPDRVWGDLARQRDGAQADDRAHVVLGFGERRAVLHAGMLVAGGTPRFAAHGSGGSLVKRGADQQEAQLLAGMAPGAPGWGADPDPLVLFDGTGGERTLAATPGDQRGYYRAIAAALTDGAPSPVPPIEAVAVMAVVEAAARSARDGCWVEPALTAAERAAWMRSREA